MNGRINENVIGQAILPWIEVCPTAITGAHVLPPFCRTLLPQLWSLAYFFVLPSH